MRIIREYAQRHTGARNVKISEGVSRVVWARGIQNPPRRVRVEIVREDEETVTLRLEGEKEGEEE
jgi:large subunit ribosomal protein L31e